MKHRRRKVPSWRRKAVLRRFIDDEDDEREDIVGQPDDKSGGDKARAS